MDAGAVGHLEPFRHGPPAFFKLAHEPEIESLQIPKGDRCKRCNIHPSGEFLVGGDQEFRFRQFPGERAIKQQRLQQPDFHIRRGALLQYFDAPFLPDLKVRVIRLPQGQGMKHAECQPAFYLLGDKIIVFPGNLIQTGDPVVKLFEGGKPKGDRIQYAAQAVGRLFFSALGFKHRKGFCKMSSAVGRVERQAACAQPVEKTRVVFQYRFGKHSEPVLQGLHPPLEHHFSGLMEDYSYSLIKISGFKEKTDGRFRLAVGMEEPCGLLPGAFP